MQRGIFAVSPSLVLSVLVGLLSGCGSIPKGVFSSESAPPPPNYSLESCWAALPTTPDMADRTPEGLENRQAQAEVDVFFLHPTTYTRKKGNHNWNGPVYDPDLNARTDEGSIHYQASLFNGVGKVYAPRYRQAHLEAYYTDLEGSAQKAFDLAYSDVKAAFEYYLLHYNEGRPFILASHSQGTTHAKRLLREFIDGKPLQEQMVVAYLAGIPVARDQFNFLKVCGGPDEIGCFTTWRTWRKGHYPKGHDPEADIAVTNPLNWTTTTAYASRSESKGAVLSNFDKIYPEATDAQVHEGLLWVDRLKFPWSFLMFFKHNFHIADLNLFYVDIRENARLRAETYLQRRP